MQTRATRRACRLVLTTALIYATVVLAAAFEHHDLSCELKTPQHCVACASTSISADSAQTAVDGAWSLPDAGRAVPVEIRVESILLGVDSTGRSPPSAAFSGIHFQLT